MVLPSGEICGSERSLMLKRSSTRIGRLGIGIVPWDSYADYTRLSIEFQCVLHLTETPPSAILDADFKIKPKGGRHDDNPIHLQCLSDRERSMPAPVRLR